MATYSIVQLFLHFILILLQHKFTRHLLNKYIKATQFGYNIAPIKWLDTTLTYLHLLGFGV